MTLKKIIFSILAVLGSIASILGFLAQIGIVPLLDPLKATIGIPLWIILGVVLLLPWIVSWATRHATSGLAERLNASTAELESHRERTQQLEARIKGGSVLAKRLSDAEGRLASYETLEAEILGLLNDGKEHDLLNIGQHTSLKSELEIRDTMVLRAINSLGDKIEGTGGKYRRKRDT